ncbi:MAG: hypothetical protein AAFO15_01205 [Pseudomonadota bacterium]
MTKKTTPDLMRVSLNKKWNVVHNADDQKENIITLYNNIIRKVLLSDYRTVVHAYKHIFPTLKCLVHFYDGLKPKFAISLAKSIVTAAARAETYSVSLRFFNNNMILNILARRNNLLLGKEGKTLADLMSFIQMLTNLDKDQIKIEVQSSHDPSPDYFARRAAKNFKSRMPLKKVQDDIELAMREYPNIEGLLLVCSGKLNGAAMARVEKRLYGRSISASTLKKDIRSCKIGASTIYGVIGVSVVLSVNNQRSYRPNNSRNIKINKGGV